MVIFCQTPIEQLKPIQVKKPVAEEAKEEVSNIDESAAGPSNFSANFSQLDSSFASFVNPTETLGEEEQLKTEMIFNNMAILKIMGVENV